MDIITKSMAPAPATPYDPMDRVRRLFDEATQDHQLTVVHDDGLYRQLRCRKPGTNIWDWDVITWPGHLAVTGDLGSFTFAREQDMLLQFFHGLDAKRGIDTRYWLEKCIAWDQHTPRRVLCSQYVKQHYRDDLDGYSNDDSTYDMPQERHSKWRQALELADEHDETTNIHEMLTFLMNNIDPDAWDWNITKPGYRALNVCLLIAWTHDRYRENLTSQVGGPE